MITKFVTLNLYEGGLLFPNIKKLLEREKPDVLTFQEAYDGKDQNLPENLRSIEALKKLLPRYYYSFAPLLIDHLPEGDIEHGNAIFSTYPIIKTNNAFFDVPYDPDYKKEEKKGDFSHNPQSLQSIEVRCGDVNLNIFNIHGIWGFDGKDNPRRLQMSRTVVEQIKDKEKVILAGDFNVQPNTQTIKNIEQHLINVFANQLTSSFNMKYKKDGGYATAVVDMVFVSHDVKVVKNYTSDLDVSDHIPLICEFEIS